jgi:tight adherence protein B
MDTTIIYALAVGGALAVAALALGLLALRRGDATLNDRIDNVLAAEQAGLRDPGDLAGGRRNLLGSWLDRRLSSMSFARRMARRLEQADLPLSAAEWVSLRVAIPAVLALAAYLIWRSLLPLPLVLLVGVIAPEMWLNQRVRRRSERFGEQLAETLSMLVSSLRGGFSIAQAMNMVARESPEPTRSELQRVIEEMQVGLSLAEALDNLATRVTVEDLELVVTTIKITGRVGGNLTGILESISTTIRERGKLRREVKVITSMQRLSATVVGLLPPVLAGLIYMINPEYIGRLFEPGWTLIIPISAFLLAITGFVVIRKLADVRV